jgi:hypothetical protein
MTTTDEARQRAYYQATTARYHDRHVDGPSKKLFQKYRPEFAPQIVSMRFGHLLDLFGNSDL